MTTTAKRQPSFKVTQLPDGQWECTVRRIPGIGSLGNTPDEAIESHKKFIPQYDEYCQKLALHCRRQCGGNCAACRGVLFDEVFNRKDSR